MTLAADIWRFDDFSQINLKCLTLDFNETFFLYQVFDPVNLLTVIIFSFVFATKSVVPALSQKKFIIFSSW